AAGEKGRRSRCAAIGRSGSASSRTGPAPPAGGDSGPRGGWSMRTGQADRGDERENDEESGRLRAALADLRGLLVQGERLEAYAVQRRLFALSRRRLIIGGFAPQDIRWQDLKDARLTVGVFGADILVTAGRGGDLAVADQGNQLLA